MGELKVIIVSTLLVLSALNGDAAVDARSALGQVFGAALDVYAPVSSVLGNSTCRAHGLLFRQGVQEGQLWALHMLDASSKLPSGLLAGNLVQLGNVDQCLAVSHAHAEHGPIRGQHCLISLGVRNSLTELRFVDKFATRGFDGTGLDAVESLLSQARFSEALSHVGATWSVCVPDSCSPGEVQRHLSSALAGRLEVRVDDQACTSRESYEALPWTAGALLVATILVCIGILIISGTVYDLMTEHATTPRNQHLVSLSLYTNGRALLKITSTPGNLDSFDGLRCLSILWIVLLHHFLFSMNAPSTNYRILDMISRDWKHLIISNGSLGVDSMLLMSGALVAVTFFRDRQRKVEFSLWRYYLNRYIRLSPLYLVALLITATLASGVSDAPFAKANVLYVEESCPQHVWFGPLYLANYFDSDHLCIGQVWSTCVDMHLFWISPLLLFSLWRKPRLGLALLMATTVVGIAAVFTEAYQRQLTLPNLIHVFVSGAYMSTMYFTTHARVTPWLIGVALGYLLHKTKGRQVALSGKQIALGWTVSLLLTSYALLGAHAYFEAGVQHDRVGAAFFIAVMRPAWALGVAWALFACEQGHGGFVNAFLSWRGWQVLSRLCYAVTFTHIFVVVGLPINMKTPQHYDDVAAVVQYIGLVVISFGLGAVLHLTVEVPSMLLYRLRMRKEPTQLKKES